MTVLEQTVIKPNRVKVMGAVALKDSFSKSFHRLRFTVTVPAALILSASSANAATFLIDASAPNTVTAFATGVATSAYNGGTASSQPSSTDTSPKNSTIQYNLAWFSAAGTPYISTRRTYFTNNGVTLGSLQYGAQTYGAFGSGSAPWYNYLTAFYTDQKSNSGLPPFDIPQINFVEVTGNYQIPEFTAASGMSVTIRFGPGASAAPAVPEPGTWAMMIGGFGMIGASLRRGQPKILAG